MQVKNELSTHFNITYNEELNISQALKNVSGWAKEIIVLDSGSTDNTIKIAESFGGKSFL